MATDCGLESTFRIHEASQWIYFQLCRGSEKLLLLLLFGR
jgi:hypothetical protein